eukprot:TRINITY_DN11823_c0_g1_i1.p1 TRINITY_DN11823_c0_g1~~TRINITY_DN11823_c0_g1_i1.p1  ORF type:complete len:546 (+),score=124.12 TRINITY_DN11823_c0_g1_i1:102-1640(+)
MPPGEAGQPAPRGNGAAPAAAAALLFTVGVLVQRLLPAAAPAPPTPQQPQQLQQQRQQRDATAPVPAAAPAPAPLPPPSEAAPPGAGGADAGRLGELLRRMGAVMRERASPAGGVMVGVADSGYARSPIFTNWWCSLQRVGAARHVAVGAVDAAAEPLLRGLGAHPVPMAEAVAEWARSAAARLSAGGAAAVWSLVAKAKPLLALAALAAGLAILLLDADIAFFADPLVYAARRLGDFDALCQPVGEASRLCCTGFMYFAPSPAALAAARHWAAVMEQLLLVDCTLKENMWCVLPDQHVWNKWIEPGLTFGLGSRPPVAALQQLPPAAVAEGGPRIRVGRLPLSDVGFASAPRLSPTANRRVFRLEPSKAPHPAVALHVAGGQSPWSTLNEGKQQALVAYRAWLPEQRDGALQWGCRADLQWPPRAELMWDERCGRVRGCVRCTWCVGVGLKTRHHFYAALGSAALCAAADLPAASSEEADFCPLPPIDPKLVRQWKAEGGGKRRKRQLPRR